MAALVPVSVCHSGSASIVLPKAPAPEAACYNRGVNHRGIIASLAKSVGVPKRRIGCKYGSNGEALELDLRGLALTELPGELAQLTTLRSLDLGHNQLTELPGNLRRLSNLEVLDLWLNRFTEVPDVVASLRRLQVLSLRCNRIPRLSPVIRKLKQLGCRSYTDAI